METDLHDTESLHQLRIQGKRLRYALELLEHGFDESLREEVYPIFVDVQDRLGAINDHVTAIAMVRKWRKNARRSQKQIWKQVIRNEKSQIAAETDEFHQWWTADQSGALQAKFEQMIREPLTV